MLAIGSWLFETDSMNPRWLLRMSRFARNPPSQQRVIMFFAILATCLLVFGIEKFIGWPSWMTLEHVPRGERLDR